jgi:zinc protease
VLNELNRNLDTPWGKLYYEMDQKIFKEHSYRHPVIGFREDLEKMTYDDMAGFYRDYYGPNNATLVVVGDCDKEKTFAKVKELFGGIEKVKTPKVPVASEPPQKAENRVEVKSDYEVARLGMAFRTAVVGSAEDYILDIVSMILAGGDDTRLHKRLVDGDQVATDVGASNSTRKHDGIFYVFAELRPQKELKAAESAIIDELGKLAKDGVGERELQKVKNLRAAQFVYEKEEQYSVADAIARFEAYGVPDYLKTYLAKIQAVTAADVQRVAKAIFTEKNRTVGLAPAGGKRSGAGDRDRKSWRKPRQSEGPAAEFGEYHEFRLPNGLTLCVKPARHLPILAIQAYVNAGHVYEDPAKAGVAHLVGDLLDQGTRPPTGAPRTAEEIAEQVAFVGGHLATGATGASIKVLTSHTGFAWDLLRDMLLHPAFPEKRVNDKRDEQLAAITSIQDSPADVARLKFYEAIYPGHPMGRPAFGLKTTVANLEREDVIAHYRRFFRPENAIIAVAGDVDPQEVLAEVRKRFGEWTGKGDFSLPAMPRVLPQEKPALITEFKEDQLQLNYAIGHLSVNRANPDWTALRVLEYVFCKGSGFTDRLSQKVRDQLGLAYSIGGDMTSGAEEWCGPFGIYFDTPVEKADPEKTKPTAYEATQVLVKELVEKGVTDKEVDAAKKYLLRSFAQRWETTDGLAAYMVSVKRLNLGVDYSLRFRRAVGAVTKEDLARVAKDHLRPEALTTVVVGPVDKDGKVKTK